MRAGARKLRWGAGQVLNIFLKGFFEMQSWDEHRWERERKVLCSGRMKKSLWEVFLGGGFEHLEEMVWEGVGFDVLLRISRLYLLWWRKIILFFGMFVTKSNYFKYVVSWLFHYELWCSSFGTIIFYDLWRVQKNHTFTIIVNILVILFKSSFINCWWMSFKIHNLISHYDYLVVQLVVY